MEDGGFTLEMRGNNRRGRAKPLDGKAAGRALAAAEGIAESSAADEADIARRIDAAVLELRASAFWARLGALVARARRRWSQSSASASGVTAAA